MAFRQFDDTSGYQGLGYGAGMLLGSLLMKEPLEKRKAGDEETDKVKRAGELLSFYVDTADKLKIPLDEYIKQLPREALEPLYKAQKTTGQYLATITQTQKPQGVTFTRGMPTSGGMAPLGALAGQTPQAPAAQGANMGPVASFVSPQATQTGPFVAPGPMPRGAKKQQRYLERQQPYGLTAPEFGYEYGGAPTALPEDVKKRIPLVDVLDPTIYDQLDADLKYIQKPTIVNLAKTFTAGQEPSFVEKAIALNKLMEEEDGEAQRIKRGAERDPAEDKAYDIILKAGRVTAAGLGMPEGTQLIRLMNAEERSLYVGGIKSQVDVLRSEFTGSLARQGYTDPEIKSIFNLVDASIPTPENLKAQELHDTKVLQKLERHATEIVTSVVGNKLDKDWTKQERNRMEKLAKERGYKSLNDFLSQYQGANRK